MEGSKGFVDFVSFLASRGQSEQPKVRPKRVIRSSQVYLDREPAQIGGHPPTAGQPKVRVYTRNDVVERIEVVCACGRTVELTLDYNNGQVQGRKGT